jgi:hypothetical protein
MLPRHITHLLSRSIMTNSVGPRVPTKVPQSVHPLTPAEQEYDAQADLVDEDHDGSVNTSYGVPGFTPQSVAGSHMTGFNAPPGGDGNSGDFGNANQLLGQYEPMLDSDPFGLSASMHFPTPFNYEQNNSRT